MRRKRLHGIVTRLKLLLEEVSLREPEVEGQELPDQAVFGARAHLALFNPFTCFVGLIRVPRLGQVPSALTWALASGMVIALGRGTR